MRVSTNAIHPSSPKSEFPSVIFCFIDVNQDMQGVIV
jgi:hypothetical protein